MNSRPVSLPHRVQPARWLLIAGLVVGLVLAMAVLPPRVAHLAPAGTVVLRVEPAVSTVVTGQEFEVTLIVDAGSQPVDAVDAFLSFDPALLQVLDLAPGAALPTILASSFDNTTGRISYSAGKQLGGPDPTGTFKLVVIHLQAQSTPAPGGTPIAFVFEPPARFTDVFFRGKSVFGSAQDGTVIIQPEPTSTPTPTPTNTPTPTATPSPTNTPTPTPTDTSTPTPTPISPTAIRVRDMDASSGSSRSASLWLLAAGALAVLALVAVWQRRESGRLDRESSQD